MTRLITPAEPVDGAPAPPSGTSADRFGPMPRVVDVSADSLSTFTSEQELGAARLAPPPPTRVVRVAPRWMRWALAALALIACTQAVLLALWWRDGGAVPGGANPNAAMTISSTPPGAPVLVDGADRGVTPVTLELEAGDHELQIGPELDRWTQTVTINAGQPSTVHVVRPAAVAGAAGELGTIEITTEPPGLPVSVDGRSRGNSPISVTGLAPGSHVVAVTRSGATVRRTVSVEAGVPTAVLITTSAAGIPSGWLAVTSPVPVQIEENGTLLGNSATPRLLLPVGRHDLTFSNDTFGYRATRTVTVTAGQAVTVALDGATGTLNVNAQPWGEVFVDGRRIGETPIGNLSLPIGNHEVIVRHPQLGERRRTVAVGVNATARVGVDLRQP